MKYGELFSSINPGAYPSAYIQDHLLSLSAMLDGWVRRRVVWYLKRDLVMGWKAKRSGRCVRCGKCCKGCIAHDAREKRCKIYKRRPAICRAFPLTPEDIKRVNTCGYQFKT